MPSDPREFLVLLDGRWGPGTRPKDLMAERVASDPTGHVAVILEGLDAPARKVQNGCAELVSLLAERQPDLLYPAVDRFVANLDARAAVLRWEAVCTLGHLAAVDAARRLPPLVPRIAALLASESIVLANHALQALRRVARAHPDTAPGVLDAVLAAAPRFRANEAGFVVEAMADFAQDPRARAFVDAHLDSPVAVMARKARRTLRAFPRA